MRKLNVSRTKELDLCVSCEVCLAVCPVDAITMENKYGQFLPKIDEEKCTKCGLCLEVCTGIDPDPSQMRHKKESDYGFEGDYLECCTAYCSNKTIRKNSTSGGVVTSLITELVKNKDFDAVFVLDFNKFNGSPARLKSTDRVDEIFSSAKSKYIPASAYEVIKTLQRQDERKYIIVATPCVIYGIKKFIRKNSLSEENLLFLGLFCEKTLNFNAMQYFKSTYKRPNEKLVKFEFRTKEKYGWPGNSKIYFDSGREIIINRQVRMQLKKYFQFNRCLFCLDKLNRFADISFGDCYVREKKDIDGSSSVIIRTKKGKSVFDRYAHLFSLDREEIDKISSSQRVSDKKENLEYIRLLISQGEIYSDKNLPYKVDRQIAIKLSKLQKLISYGKTYNIKKIKYNPILPIIQNCLDILSKIKGNKSRPRKNTKENIIIVGGELFNKGAQAMVFTAVDQIKRKSPNKNVYLFSRLDFSRKEEEKNIYAFNILPWNLGTRVRLLYPWMTPLLRISKYSHLANRIKEVVRNTDFIIDVSGYALSSQWSILRSISYLLNIMFAKKHSLPYCILPQSIGPFNYPVLYKIFLFPMMKSLLKYPERIFVREEEGLNWVHKFRENNVEKSYDMVLQSENYNLSNIYTKKPLLKDIRIEANSVCVIPNCRVIERTDRNKIFIVYEKLIKELVAQNKTVYILRHSYEDLGACEKIKKPFSNDGNVKLIAGELNAIELENVIKQCGFIIASRYHSVVHAYKNGVPALVIGWANKYFELLKEFSQLDYFTDCRDTLDADIIVSKLTKMVENYKQEKERICDKMMSVKKGDIFDALFSSMKNKSANI